MSVYNCKAMRKEQGEVNRCITHAISQVDYEGKMAFSCVVIILTTSKTIISRKQCLLDYNLKEEEWYTNIYDIDLNYIGDATVQTCMFT